MHDYPSCPTGSTAYNNNSYEWCSTYNPCSFIPSQKRAVMIYETYCRRSDGSTFVVTNQWEIPYGCC